MDGARLPWSQPQRPGLSVGQPRAEDRDGAVWSDEEAEVGGTVLFSFPGAPRRDCFPAAFRSAPILSALRGQTGADHPLLPTEFTDLGPVRSDSPAEFSTASAASAWDGEEPSYVTPPMAPTTINTRPLSPFSLAEKRTGAARCNAFNWKPLDAAAEGGELEPPTAEGTLATLIPARTRIPSAPADLSQSDLTPLLTFDFFEAMLSL